MLTALKSQQYNLVLDSVPRSIADVLECPPVLELINQGATVNDLEACLAVEIAKAANMLTVGGNLRQGQSVEIARTLIADYPGESLQDFCLCLRSGVKGAYGDIFRFDILIIHEWFKRYLEEKYQVVEDKLMSEKENIYAKVDYQQSDRDWLGEWQEAVNGGMKEVPKLSEDEIKNEGQEKPKRKIHEYNASEAEIRMREHLEKIFQAQELTVRERHPDWNEEQIQARLIELQEQIYDGMRNKGHVLPSIEKIWKKKKRKLTA